MEYRKLARRIQAVSRSPKREDRSCRTTATLLKFRPPPKATRASSKYDRLIAKAKSAAAAKTIVVHPCDETSLRGPIEAAEAGIIIPILVGPADKITAVAREHKLDIGKFELVDAPHSDGGCRKGGRTDSPGEGRAADEGQPAHRRTDAGGHRVEHGTAHRAAHQPRLRHGCADLFRDAFHHRRRDQHIPRSRRQARHHPERDRSVSRRSASARPASRSSPPSRP